MLFQYRTQHHRRPLLLPFLLTTASALSALPALADSPDALQKQIDSLQQEVDALKHKPAEPAAAPSVGSTLSSIIDSDGPLTWHGITVYGTIDIGISNQTHGTPLNSDYSPGVEELIAKNSNRSQTSVTPNGLSQSKFGIKGTETVYDDLSVVFKAEGGFSPVSGSLANGVKSVQDNNGIPVTQQSSNGDSSRAGQLFNSVAFAGLSSPVWGTVTFGRQNGVLADVVANADPQNSAYAFSLIGYSGLAGGGGATEDYRLDDSIKYTNKYGPVRFAALYQFSGNTNPNGGDQAYQFNLGLDYAGATLDAVYAKKQDAVSVSASTALTNTTLGATISDNTAFGFTGTYRVPFVPVRVYAGIEQITFANPSKPLAVGNTILGGYQVSTVNNAAYTNNKVQFVEWTGLRYSATSTLDIIAAYYRYAQDNFSGTSNSACVAVNKTKCEGEENVVSLAADYQLTKRFDLYAGFAYSRVDDGLYLGSGDLHNNTLSTMMGGRFNF